MSRGLVLALDLLRAPVLGEVMRGQPLLPSKDMLVLLRIAGDCAETSREAVEATGKSPEHIKEAVVLYLKQILLFPDADSYRVLGVDPQAPQATIREHLHWMMRWLHPDRNRNSWDSVFASRVLSAWDDLKTPQRRQAYDQLRDRTIGSEAPGPQATTRRAGIPWVATPLERRQHGQTWLRTLIVTLGQGFSAWRLLSHRLFPKSSADEAGTEKATGAFARANAFPGEPKDIGTRAFRKLMRKPPRTRSNHDQAQGRRGKVLRIRFARARVPWARNRSHFGIQVGAQIGHLDEAPWSKHSRAGLRHAEAEQQSRTGETSRPRHARRRGFRSGGHYDFYYNKHFSPWIEVLIAARTVRIVLTGFGSR